jgi:predicted DNA-binding protein
MRVVLPTGKAFFLPRGGVMRTFPIQFGLKMAVDQETRLMTLAQRQKTSMSELVRQAVEELLVRLEQASAAPPDRRRPAKSA